MGFILSGWLVIRRDKASLTASENAMVVRLGLSLFLFIPLAAGDFLLLYTGLPIQFSALGVLILCWLAIGLGRTHLGHRATLMNLSVMILAAIIVGGMIGMFAELERNGYLLVIAVIMTTLFLVTILTDARALRLEEQSLGLLNQLATAKTDDPMTFLRDLQDHPLVEGAVVVSEDSLTGLQDEVLEQIFSAAPVLRRSCMIRPSVSVILAMICGSAGRPPLAKGPGAPGRSSSRGSAERPPATRASFACSKRMRCSAASISSW